jgi:hypothetical protein
MSEERLKRVEVLLETCAKMTVDHQARIQQLEAKNQELEARQQEVEIEFTLRMNSLLQMFEESIAVIKTMQSQVRGIQTENQRILNHLFGENQE